MPYGESAKHKQKRVKNMEISPLCWSKEEMDCSPNSTAKSAKGKKAVAAKEVKPPPKDDSEDDEATSDSDAEPQKRAGKKAVVAKEVKPSPKGESEDDEATSESDAEPQKQTGKKAAAAKDVKLPPKDDSEDDEATSESDAKPQNRTGKKAAAAKEVKLPPKDDSEDDEATSESDAKPQKRAGKKAAAAKEVKLPPKDESEDDEATSESDAPPLNKSVSKSTKQWDKKSKLSGKKMDVGESNAKKPKQTGKKVNAKVEDSVLEAKPLNLSLKKGHKSKSAAEEEEESDSENKALKLSAKKGNLKKKDDGRNRGSGKNATENDQAKAMSSDDVSDTIKYDKSLVGSKVKVWWPEDKMYYEGVIESFDAAKKKHKVLYVDGESETVNLKTEKWEILKEYSVHNEGVLPVTRKLGEGVSLKSADKLKTYLIPAIISMGDTLDNYTKVVASVCETATIEHNDENASGQQPAKECKLEKESKYKAHQADESNLATASSDYTGQVFKEGACPEEVDSILDRYLKSVMTNGVDVTGNEEASVDREPSKKPEKEDINQKNLNKTDTNGSDDDKELKRKDQASKKRGKEVDTVINSTEPMVGLAHKRAGRETSDQSAKKSRVSGVAGGSSLVPPRVSSSLAASGHVPFRDMDVTGLPSPQMFLPGALTPAMEERVRQMGVSGGVDQLEGMANESAALFSHAVQSIRALERSLSDREEKVRTLNFRLARDAVRQHKRYEEHSKRWAELSARHAAEKKVSESRITELESLVKAKELENSELKKQLDELVCRDKGYDEKNSVLEREVADLKSLDEQMKLSWEARAMDAERRATEAEKRLAEAKRKMVEAEGTVKAVLASFAL